MSTTTSGPRTPTPTPTPTPAAGAEERFLYRGADRALYEAIDANRGESSVPRMAWIGRELELMSPSPEHDDLADLLSLLVIIVADTLELDYRSLRTTTWRRPELERGKEADACFFFTGPAAALGRGRLDLKNMPSPDLAIEVELSPPKVDVERIYADLGVSELWRHDGERLRILHLGPDGRYAEHDRSRHIPRLRADDVIAQLARADELAQRAWKRAVEHWAREDLARRPA